MFVGLSMPSSLPVGVWNRRFHCYPRPVFPVLSVVVFFYRADAERSDWFRMCKMRHETQYDPDIETPAGKTRLSQTLDVMRQLNLKGEIDWPDGSRFGHIDFNVSRLWRAQVRVDLYGPARVCQDFYDGSLHGFQIFDTFSGSIESNGSKRDWAVTSAWALAMDALAAGLIVMVVGSYSMWWRLKKRKTLGCRPGPWHISLCGLSRSLTSWGDRVGFAVSASAAGNHGVGEAPVCGP